MTDLATWRFQQRRKKFPVPPLMLAGFAALVGLVAFAAVNRGDLAKSVRSPAGDALLTEAPKKGGSTTGAKKRIGARKISAEEARAKIPSLRKGPKPAQGDSLEAVCYRVNRAMPETSVVQWGADTQTGWPMARIHFPEREETTRMRKEIESKQYENPAQWLLGLKVMGDAANVVTVLEAPVEFMAETRAREYPRSNIIKGATWRNFCLWGDPVCIDKIIASLK